MTNSVFRIQSHTQIPVNVIPYCVLRIAWLATHLPRAFALWAFAPPNGPSCADILYIWPHPAPIGLRAAARSGTLTAATSSMLFT